jgi:hypothetical protein
LFQAPASKALETFGDAETSLALEGNLLVRKLAHYDMTTKLHQREDSTAWLKKALRSLKRAR